MKNPFCIVALSILVTNTGLGQHKLPVFNKSEITIHEDWLIEEINSKAALYSTQEGYLVFSNGLVSRTFSLEPNGATVGLENLQSEESFLRSVRPEAEVQIDGINFQVGGLTSQPIHNYLLPEWLREMKSIPGSFRFKNYKIEETRERFPWQKRLEWIPKDMPWPAPGKELIFSYMLDDRAIEIISERSLNDDSRTVLFIDNFESLNDNWERYESKADHRNSFSNEGKAGEIMALSNTAVFAEKPIISGAEIFLVKINPGTDKSLSWGPGMGLVFDDHVIKINLRPNQNQFGFFNGDNEINIAGMKSGQSVWLRLELNKNKVLASYSYDKSKWIDVGEATLSKRPKTVRVGKMDWSGKFSDHEDKGSRGRCHIEEFQMLGAAKEEIKNNSVDRNNYLKDITVNVHYELYDGLPVFCKWITVHNNSGKTIRIDKYKSEILAVTEPESIVDPAENWLLPNITIETDYNFGGMSSENILHSSVAWNDDPLYKTQVNYTRKTPCLLEVYPKYGPAQEVKPGGTFNSYRVWELLNDSWERERKGLAHRRMMRSMAPWVTENPILMHVRSAENEAVKKAIDQCAEVGFEKVIMTFGSGFNAEDTSLENIERMKKLADYAHSKGITLGGYSLLASRSVGEGNDVVMPEGMSPRFGNSPCIESEWGHNYFEKLYNLYEKTGLDNFEHDGSYPGDICISTDHPGHKGLEDSQWNQYKRITDFYKWCRSKGIYLNVPDYYFLAGSNKTGMGYRETNWSLPREQQEIIERQNIYDGTWSKTPSMGWMFVPLVQYHGGGAEATIEPLKEHLPHYNQRLANLFSAGVQACYRGPQLYDAPETKALVKKWVDFYKKYRRILDGDIIHIRRPDGMDYDGILHVEPTNDIKGMLVVYNPTDQVIRKKIKVPLYYSGISDFAKIREQENHPKLYKLDRDYKVELEITIQPKGYNWYAIEE